MISRNENEWIADEDLSFSPESEEMHDDWSLDDTDHGDSEDDGWGSDDAFGDGTGTHEDPGPTTAGDPPPLCDSTLG